MLKILNYWLVVLIIAATLAACGKEKDGCSNSDTSAINGKDGCKAETKGIEKDAATVDQFVLRGSITSAFAVTVDGEAFNDLESFYTTEVGRLPAKVQKQGYAGYDVKFDAAIGFDSLYQGMTVYIQGAEKRGYQARTTVARDGTFAVNMEPDAAGDTYMIRANKRVAVILSKDGETPKKYCYNFSAVDLSVPYAEKDKPIQISSFTSTITALDCVADAPTGINLPANADAASTQTVTEGGAVTTPIIDAARNLIRPGLEASNIYTVFGGGPTTYREFGDIEGPGSAGGWWRLDYFTAASGLCAKDANIYLDTDCRVLIDLRAAGMPMLWADGVRAEYLAPGATFPTEADIKKLLGVDAL